MFLFFSLLALAGIVEVTFTGNIDWTFDSDWGGDSYHGIKIGDSFSLVLTYNHAQSNFAGAEYLSPGAGNKIDLV